MTQTREATPEELQLLKIRGLIAQMPVEDQALVRIVRYDIDEIVQRTGTCGIYGLTLIAAEMAAKENL